MKILILFILSIVSVLSWAKDTKKTHGKSRKPAQSKPDGSCIGGVVYKEFEQATLYVDDADGKLEVNPVTWVPDGNGGMKQADESLGKKRASRQVSFRKLQCDELKGTWSTVSCSSEGSPYEKGHKVQGNCCCVIDMYLPEDESSGP